jgi:hypothetical protein
MQPRKLCINVLERTRWYSNSSDRLALKHLDRVSRCPVPLTSTFYLSKSELPERRPVLKSPCRPRSFVTTSSLDGNLLVEECHVMSYCQLLSRLTCEWATVRTVFATFMVIVSDSKHALHNETVHTGARVCVFREPMCALSYISLIRPFRCVPSIFTYVFTALMSHT